MRHQYEPFSPTITGRRGPCARRHLEAARFGDDVVGHHRVALVLEQVLGAPRAEVLLVGDREVDERAARREARAGEVAERDRHRRGEVEHVDRAAAPDLAVDDLAAERIAPPAVGVHRHDVGVAHQQQRRRGRIAALDARDEVLAARAAPS